MIYTISLKFILKVVGLDNKFTIDEIFSPRHECKLLVR